MGVPVTACVVEGASLVLVGLTTAAGALGAGASVAGVVEGAAVASDAVSPPVRATSTVPNTTTTAVATTAERRDRDEKAGKVKPFGGSEWFAAARYQRAERGAPS